MGKQNCGGHKVVMCQVCKKVIMQCRCMDKNKPVYFDICEECKSKEKEKSIREKIIDCMSNFDTDYVGGEGIFFDAVNDIETLIAELITTTKGE